MDAVRARKLSDRIAQIAAEMLERRVKDPRLGFVTVTDARITNDLREASVYYTVYGSDEEQAGTAVALKSATGLIRSEIGRQTGLKHTPSLEFIRDTLPEGARSMEELVAQARAADEALAETRQGAQPAGDPDPYRVPRDQADDDEFDDDDDEFDDDDEDGDGGHIEDDARGASDPASGDLGDGYLGDGPLGRGYPAAPGTYGIDGPSGIDGRGGAARRRR
jgi:ribosome-binding factor A